MLREKPSVLGLRLEVLGPECESRALTIDSNEMFENEAIHQGVDTLATCVQNAQQFSKASSSIEQLQLQHYY